MARRFSAPYQSEPFSRLATWARNLAIFSVVAVLVSILIVRFGFLEMKPALATFFGALGIAALSILIGLAGFAAIWPGLPRLQIQEAAADPRHHH
jgi:cytochrome c biogenesis factor